MITNDRGARALLASTALLGIGMGVYLLALGQLLFQLTGGPGAFAYMLALQGVGALLVLPFSGPLVDAADSRYVYLTCSVLRAVLVCAVALVAVLDMPGDVVLIGVGVFMLAMFDNVQRAALFKFTAWQVSAANRSRLNGLLNVAIQVGAITGMALLGILLIWVSIAAALLVDGLVALGSAWLMARAKPALSGVASAEPRRRMTGGALGAALPAALHDWRGMRRRYRSDLPVLAMVVLCAADFLFQGGLSSLIVPLVEEHYGGRNHYVSLLEGVFALGMVVATLFLRLTARQRLLPLWVALQAGMALSLAGAESRTLHFVTLFVAGFANLTSVTWLITTLQERADAAEKGKMASLRLLAIGLGTVCLMPLIGASAAVSLDTGFLALAAIILPFVLMAVFVTARYRPDRTVHARHAAAERIAAD